MKKSKLKKRLKKKAAKHKQQVIDFMLFFTGDANCIICGAKRDRTDGGVFITEISPAGVKKITGKVIKQPLFLPSPLCQHCCDHSQIEDIINKRVLNFLKGDFDI